MASGAEVAVSTSNTLKTYRTRLPIGAGELFAVDANTGPAAAVPGAAFRLDTPALANGATALLTNLRNDRPGETCAARIRFAPTAPGARAATLLVRGSADSLGQVFDGTDVALSGTGVAPVTVQATPAPNLVAILLGDRLSVRRGRALRATVFSTAAGRASVRILRRSTTLAATEADVRAGRTSSDSLALRVRR